MKSHEEYRVHLPWSLETFMRLHMIQHHRFVFLFLEIHLVTTKKLEIKARTNTSGDIWNSSTAATAVEYCTLKLLVAISSVPGCARYVPELVALLVITTMYALVNEANAP
jgi:hypothetical protein